MIRYFKELLATLKRIDANLTEIRATQDELRNCFDVPKHDRPGSTRRHIRTGHWND